MTVEKKDTHVSTALDRLLSVLKTKPFVRSLVTVLTTALQELEEVFWDIRTKTDVENAIGEQQNVLGRVVGQDRLGFDDATYKLYLKARIQLNQSSGTIPEIIELFQLICPVGTTVTLTQLFPKKLHLILGGVGLTPTQVTLFAQFLEAATDAGVGWWFSWNPTDDAHSFTFAGGPGLGFGDTTNAATGGELSGVIAGV